MDLLSSLNKNGSGLNLRELAQTLAMADTAPQISALRAKSETDSVRLSAFGQIRTQMDALAGVLAKVATNPVLTVTTTSAAILPKVTDRAKLQNGTVPIEVTALATRQVLEFGGFSGGAQTLEAGRLTLDFGRWDTAGTGFAADASRAPVEIDIPPGATLQDLAARLTEIEGVTARVLDKGDGTFSLGIVGEFGGENGLRLTAGAAVQAGDVPLTAFDTTLTNADRQVQAAADARVVIDGISIQRSTNVLTDVLPGMEITLSAITSGQLTVERDENAARSNVEALIGGLNDTLALLRGMTGRGAGESALGNLPGDRNIETIEQSLRRLIATPLEGHGGRAVSLADLGIATQRNGTLRFDPPAFDRTFRERAGDFDALFVDSLRSMTEGLSVAGTAGAALTSGSMDFRVGPGGATLNGFTMLGLDLGDGRRGFVATTGPVQGLTLTAEAGVTSGTVAFGRSFIGSLAAMLDQVGQSTGVLGRRETEVNRLSGDNQRRIESLEARASLLEKRYLTRFAAMEQAITSMKSTGGYIQNLVDLWSKSGR